MLRMGDGHVLGMDMCYGWGTVMFLEWTCVIDGGWSCSRNGHVLWMGDGHVLGMDMCYGWGTVMF